MIRAGSMSMASLRNFAASAVRRGRVASSSSARSLATVHAVCDGRSGRAFGCVAMRDLQLCGRQLDKNERD